MAARRRIRLIAVGGTIACLPNASGDGATARLTAGELSESVPGLAAIADIDAVEREPIASFALTTAQILDLAQDVEAGFDDGCTGVVLTHGTDTLEELAYGLALMLPRLQPVVVTGAMRNPSLPGSDGPANLLAAFQAAASPRVAPLGPIVVMNEEIHAARFVTKAHSSRPHAVSSPYAGPVGELVEGEVHVWYHPAYEDFAGRPASVEGVVVELVRMIHDASPTALRAVATSGAAGLVLEGTGGGHVPPSLLDALDAVLATGMPVVLATRCQGGGPLTRTYGMPGGEIDLIGRGLIPAGNLSGQKARLRLLVGLAAGREPVELFPVG